MPIDRPTSFLNHLYASPTGAAVERVQEARIMR